MKTEPLDDTLERLKRIVKNATCEQDCINTLLSENLIKTFSEGRQVWASIKADKLILG